MAASVSRRACDFEEVSVLRSVQNGQENPGCQESVQRLGSGCLRTTRKAKADLSHSAEHRSVEFYPWQGREVEVQAQP